MSLTASDSVTQSPFVIRAEMALRALKNDVINHIDRESRLCRFYGQWHENWLSRAEQLRQQVNAGSRRSGIIKLVFPGQRWGKGQGTPGGTIDPIPSPGREG